MQTKIRNINDMMGLVNNMDSIDETTKLEMIIQWLSTYLNQQDIVDIINERLKDLENEEKNSDDNTSKNVDDTDLDIDIGGGSDSFGPPTGGLNHKGLDLDEPNLDELDLEGPEEIEEPEIAETTNLADIEGQDLL